MTELWSPSERELERREVRRRQRVRQTLIAAVVTVVVFAVLAIGVVSSPGWPRVHETFFNGFHARESFDAILHGFWINVKLFLICEPVILVLAMAVALARTARSPWLLPVRLVAVGYTDVFRGIPTILLVVLLAFGMPALQLQGIPNSALFWAGVALILSYGAYVAEVFRAGIDSIHPSQVSSASALGLSRAQTMRFVVVPQAVRRVIPPLLNDFVSLQKDTALVAAAGVFDAVFAARDYGNFNFNYTPLVVVAGFFVVMTVPLARLCDWLQRRWMERERAGAL
jgi:polar amino acid transport system permease protein